MALSDKTMAAECKQSPWLLLGSWDCCGWLSEACTAVLLVLPYDRLVGGRVQNVVLVSA
jgi:hypothetical protein